MKSLAFIDNFVESPVIHGVNDYIIHSKSPCTYHMPAKFGMKSLNKLTHYDGLVILGSASHVTENHEWHQELLDFVIPKLESGVPVLGICFGHQLIASHYGCEVGYAQEDKFKFLEARQIIINQKQLGMDNGKKLNLGYAHSQVVKKCSEDMISFASSEKFPNEALYHKKYPFWSFQAHPEASREFLTEEAKIEDQKIIDAIKLDGFYVIDQFLKSL